MSKVTVVGAGTVGATCANVLAFNEVADAVVMLDVKEGASEGKAMDMMQTAQLLGLDVYKRQPQDTGRLQPKCGKLLFHFLFSFYLFFAIHNKGLWGWNMKRLSFVGAGLCSAH